MARKWRREGKGISAVVLPELRAAAHYATDRATTFGLNTTRDRIRGAGLGRLANAVGSTSSLKRGRSRDSDNAWGAIFARGKAQSRGNQALLAYSEGADIYPRSGRKWLAFPTDRIPKRAGGFKMTPKGYVSSGLVQSIGKLRFVPGKGGRVAFLVADNVNVSRKTGRARVRTGRKPRGADAKKSVIAFILIRWTRRAARFSQKEILMLAQAQTGSFVEEYQRRRR